MSGNGMFNDDHRYWQDRFDSRRIADRIDELLVSETIDDAREDVHRVARHVLPRDVRRRRPSAVLVQGRRPGLRPRRRRPARSPFPSTTATACSCRSATSARRRTSACCSSTSSSRTGCGVERSRDGRRRRSPARRVRGRDPRRAGADDAGVPELRPLHPQDAVGRALGVRAEAGTRRSPIPDWKRMTWAQEHLPDDDPARRGTADRLRESDDRARVAGRRRAVRTRGDPSQPLRHGAPRADAADSTKGTRSSPQGVKRGRVNNPISTCLSEYFLDRIGNPRRPSPRRRRASPSRGIRAPRAGLRPSSRRCSVGPSST